MKPLREFIAAATAILNRVEPTLPEPKPQPPVFVRTTWIFAEVDEAIERCGVLSHQIKIARLNNNRVEAQRLTQNLIRSARQIAEMARWADEQFQRETDK